MNKKKSVVLTLFLIVVFILTTCLLAACVQLQEEDNNIEAIDPTEGLLITNSDFKSLGTSTAQYPRTLTGWTGAKMYSSSSFRDDVTAGAINLADSVYKANSSRWDDADNQLLDKLKAGGRYGDDDEIKNALMIYMPEEGTNANGDAIHGPTAYSYTSSSFTLSKGSYYKLTVDVLTHNIKGKEGADEKPGARIYVSANTYVEYDGIDTNDTWQTFEIYIETSPVSTTSLTLQLCLGKYTSTYSLGLTTGYVFFDNLELVKLEEEDGKTPEEMFETAQQEEISNSYVKTTTLKVPNGSFEFGSTTLSTSGTPSLWTSVTGNSSKSDPAPTSQGYNAVIDLSKFDVNYQRYATTQRIKRNDSASAAEDYNPASSLADINNGEAGGLLHILGEEGHLGSNVFMLSQQTMTAQGIRSSRSITIEKNKLYALSIRLYTFSIHGAGVSLILTGSDGRDIVIKGISHYSPTAEAFIGRMPISDATNGYVGAEEAGNSTGKWTTYTFYLRGNQYMDYNYNMAIWLGTEGTNSNTQFRYKSFTSDSTITTYTSDGTFSNGWVFVDDLALVETTDDSLAASNIKTGNADNNYTLDFFKDAETYHALYVDLSTPASDNAIKDIIATGTSQSSLGQADIVTPLGQGAPTGWKSRFDVEDSNNPIIAGNVFEGIVDLTDADAFLASANANMTYPEQPYNIASKNAYAIYAAKDAYYEVETGDITIEPNKFYRISFWVKTVDVKSTTGAYISLLNQTARQKNIDENKPDADADVVLTSFTSVNTKNYDEYLNDWCEIRIVIRGDYNSAEPTKVALKFALGSGDRWSNSTLTTGALYVANFNMASITYANFTDTSTGTYTKSVNLSSSVSQSTYAFANGNFDSYDQDDVNLVPGTALAQQTAAATPNNWTISDSTLDANSEGSDLVAGVIALEKDNDRKPAGWHFKASTQATTATGITDGSVFDNFYADELTDANYLANGGPNVLAIGRKQNASADSKFAVGFSSNSITLSANTFYKLSVYAKTYGATTASIFLTGEASSTGENTFLIKSEATGAGEWTLYTFYIEVGRTSVSLRLNLWLGQDPQYIKNNDGESDEQKAERVKNGGMVFFDNADYVTMDEDDFEAARTEEADNQNAKFISFLTDSFDALSSTVEARGKLSSPTGWTGAAGTNQSSSNTLSGIIYTDANYFTQREITVDDATEHYVGILGVDYQLEDITVSDAELAQAITDRGMEDASEEEKAQLQEELREKKLLDQKRNHWIPVDSVKARTENTVGQILVINNTAKSAYTYTSNNATLNEDSFYKVSVWVRTYGLNSAATDKDAFDGVTISDEELNEAKQDAKYNGWQEADIIDDLKRIKLDAGAYIELYLGSANDSTNPLIFEAIRQDEWTEYTFYVKTLFADVTSVNIRLSLGKYISGGEVNGETVITGLTLGYAMFDDVTIEKLDDFDDDMFEAIEEGDTIVKRVVQDQTAGNTDEEPEDNEPAKSSFNLTYLWWMIPTIILGLVIIVVVIVFVIRKLRKNKGSAPKVKAAKPEAPAAAETLNEKRNRYDDDKD